MCLAAARVYACTPHDAGPGAHTARRDAGTAAGGRRDTPAVDRERRCTWRRSASSGTGQSATGPGRYRLPGGRDRGGQRRHSSAAAPPQSSSDRRPGRQRSLARAASRVLARVDQPAGLSGRRAPQGHGGLGAPRVHRERDVARCGTSSSSTPSRAGFSKMPRRRRSHAGGSAHRWPPTEDPCRCAPRCSCGSSSRTDDQSRVAGDVPLLRAMCSRPRRSATSAHTAASTAPHQAIPDRPRSNAPLMRACADAEVASPPR